MINTFAAQGKWYKGNLHAHSAVSDGIQPSEWVAEQYRALGYSFLALADHRIWRTHEALCTQDFLMLPGIELDASFGDRPGKHYHHIVGVGLSDIPDGYRRDNPPGDARQVAQAHIDWLVEGGCTPIYCHPNWSMATVQEVEALNGFALLEVYNHLCHGHDGSGEAEAWWDHLLWQGRKVLCCASDDTHQKFDDIGGGFIMVKATELSREAIWSAIRAGQFYATQGPVFEDISLQDGKLCVKSSPVARIDFKCFPLRGGALVGKEAALTEGAFAVPAGSTYIRVVLTDTKGRKAWSQPVYFEEGTP